MVAVTLLGLADDAAGDDADDDSGDDTNDDPPDDGGSGALGLGSADTIHSALVGARGDGHKLGGAVISKQGGLACVGHSAAVVPVVVVVAVIAVIAAVAVVAVIGGGHGALDEAEQGHQDDDCSHLRLF